MKYPASHHRAKATIRACVDSSTGIDFIADAPNFRYIPGEAKVLNGPPSHRRLDFKRKPHMRDCKNWSPPAIRTGPDDYLIPMAGDGHKLEQARRCWAKGDPEPLRELLASRPWVRPIEYQEAA